MTETENNGFLETYTRQCSEEITRNSVEMEFHPFQSKEPDPRIRFSFGKTTAQNVTKEEAPRVISRKIRVGMTFSAELARNCADEIAHSLLLDKSQRPTRDIVQMKRAICIYVQHFPYLLDCIYLSIYCENIFLICYDIIDDYFCKLKKKSIYIYTIYNPCNL